MTIAMIEMNKIPQITKLILKTIASIVFKIKPERLEIIKISPVFLFVFFHESSLESVQGVLTPIKKFELELRIR